MVIEKTKSSADQTAARAQAHLNFTANIRALRSTQAPLFELLATDFTLAVGELEFVFAKDGFLTALDAAGQWMAGCSIPKLASLSMLKNLHLPGPVGCYLSPTHAGQITAALEILTGQQGIVVIQPNAEDLAFMLCCCDFSEQIMGSRLFFVTGANWASMLIDLFNRCFGLSTPSQFIRTSFTDDEIVEALIPVAEAAFREINDARATKINQLKSTYRPSDARKKVLVVGSTHFRLWEDEGYILTQSLCADSATAIAVNPDNPADSSGYNLAVAGANCQAMVIANRFRHELPEVIADDLPVFSWITQGRIGPFDPRFKRDALIVADEKWVTTAKSLLWPDDRIRIATWPDAQAAGMEIATSFQHVPSLGFIANTYILETPRSRLELSSHHVLWELIRHDISIDPFSIGSNINEFINRRTKKLGISDEGLDRTLFINQLIVPAWQQGIIRILINAGIPVKLFGSNWNQIDGMAQCWQGSVQSRDEFKAAKQAVSILINPSMIKSDHPVLHQNMPVIDAYANNAHQWINRARTALNTKTGSVNSVNLKIPAVSISTIDELLR